MIAISEIERVIEELKVELRSNLIESYKDGSRATIAHHAGKVAGLKISISKLKELIPSEANNTRDTSQP